MPRIQESQTKTGPVLTITIPRAIAKFKGWKKGDRLEFKEDNGKVLLEKAE
jgi:bifunctional DNA-binding transcriptional regulator/antitoxin component of YhaV-PrlF toxin-antitoxin module